MLQLGRRLTFESWNEFRSVWKVNGLFDTKQLMCLENSRMGENISDGHWLWFWEFIAENVQNCISTRIWREDWKTVKSLLVQTSFSWCGIQRFYCITSNQLKHLISITFDISRFDCFGHAIPLRFYSNKFDLKRSSIANDKPLQMSPVTCRAESRNGSKWIELNEKVKVSN